MRGRKPTPTSLHKLRGTHNATRHGKARKGEPVAAGDLMNDPPSWMSEAQQDGWRYAMEHAPIGILKFIDRGILAVWVEAESRHRTAMMKQAELDANSSAPLLTKSKKGDIMVSPYLGIMNAAAALMIKAGSELGFSPASRPRLAVGGGMVDTPAAEQQISPWAKLKVIQGGKAKA